MALLEADPISITHRALGGLTFRAMPPSKKADFLKELNEGGVGEGKEEEGVDADEEGKETADCILLEFVVCRDFNFIVFSLLFLSKEAKTT